MRKIFAAGYSVVLVLILLWPVPVDQSGATNTLVKAILGFADTTPGLGWLDYNFLESTANILLFVPLGYLATAIWPKSNHLLVMAVGVGISLTAELLQLFVVTQRVFSLDDVLHNGLGSALGVALATWLGKSHSNEPRL
ncbi:MAG: VanZ family protein [Micrococcales bacterium]